MPPGPRFRHHPRRLENEEKVRSLADIGERLQKLGSVLAERNHFRFGRTDVVLPDECKFIMRLERTPRGEFSLRLEMLWEEHIEEPSAHPDEDLEIY